MAMVLHPRNENEKKFVRIFHDLLKALGVSRVGYASTDLKIEGQGYSLDVKRGDLIAVAQTPKDKDALLAAVKIYHLINNFETTYLTHENITPEMTYLDAERIALAKLLYGQPRVGG